MFGNRLANERKRLGLTQQDLATELNVSRAAIAMCETGKNNMDNRSLAILAQKLNFDMNYLITGKSTALEGEGSVDWVLLLTIQDTVNALAKERGLTLVHDKKLRLFKMIYKHCLVKRELDMPFINEVFALAA